MVFDWGSGIDGCLDCNRRVAEDYWGRGKRELPGEGDFGVGCFDVAGNGCDFRNRDNRVWFFCVIFVNVFRN